MTAFLGKGRDRGRDGEQKRISRSTYPKRAGMRVVGRPRTLVQENQDEGGLKRFKAVHWNRVVRPSRRSKLNYPPSRTLGRPTGEKSREEKQSMLGSGPPVLLSLLLSASSFLRAIEQLAISQSQFADDVDVDVCTGY